MHADTNADADREAAVWQVLAGAIGQALAGGLGWYNAILSAEGELWAKHVVIRLCQDVPDRVKRQGAAAVLEAASQLFASMMEGVAA